MAVEMPDQVVAAVGATAVEFPWATASAAVEALDRAVAALTSQARARARMEGTLGDWQGRFRGDFDDGYGDIVAAAATLADELASRAGSIVDGANAANDEQMRRNEAAAGAPG